MDHRFVILFDVSRQKMLIQPRLSLDGAVAPEVSARTDYCSRRRLHVESVRWYGSGTYHKSRGAAGQWLQYG